MPDCLQEAAVSFEAGFELQADQQCAYNLVVCAHACGDAPAMQEGFWRLAQVQKMSKPRPPSTTMHAALHAEKCFPWATQVQTPDILLGNEAGDGPSPALSPAERLVDTPTVTNFSYTCWDAHCEYRTQVVILADARQAGAGCRAADSAGAGEQ